MTGYRMKWRYTFDKAPSPCCTWLPGGQPPKFPTPTLDLPYSFLPHRLPLWPLPPRFFGPNRRDFVLLSISMCLIGLPLVESLTGIQLI